MRQILLFCISSVIVIHSIHYESAVTKENISDVTNTPDIHEDELDEASNSEDIEEREGRQLFNLRPLRFRRPLLSARAASLFATIPTLFGEK